MRPPRATVPLARPAGIWSRRRRCGRCWPQRCRAREGTGGRAAPPCGGSPGGRPRGNLVLAVTATAREADDLAAALGSFLPPEQVACFPGWETLPHERLSPRSDTVGQRIAVLRRLAHPRAEGDPDGPLAVVVAPVRSLLQPIVAGLGDLEPVILQPGQAFELDDLLIRLVEIGYSRVDLVGSRGEVAVRGGIVDVFPPTEEHPLRVEFFGDQVEEIRYFKVADQRSIGPAERGLWAPPCRELLLTPAVRERAKVLADTHPELADILGKLAEGITVEGMEAFAPVLAERMELLVDYVPQGRPGAGLRPRAGPGPGRGAGPHQPGVPGSVLGQRRGGRGGPGRPGRGRVPADRARPRVSGRAWPAVVDGRPVRGHRFRRGGRGRRGQAGADHGRRRRPTVPDQCLPGPRLSRRRQPHDRRRAPLAGRRLAGRAGHRGTRACAPPGRDAPRRGNRRPAVRPGRAARGRCALRDHGTAGERLHLAGGRGWPC